MTSPHSNIRPIRSQAAPPPPRLSHKSSPEERVQVLSDTVMELLAAVDLQAPEAVDKFAARVAKWVAERPERIAARARYWTERHPPPERR